LIGEILDYYQNFLVRYVYPTKNPIIEDTVSKLCKIGWNTHVFLQVESITLLQHLKTNVGVGGQIQTDGEAISRGPPSVRHAVQYL